MVSHLFCVLFLFLRFLIFFFVLTVLCLVLFAFVIMGLYRCFVSISTCVVLCTVQIWSVHCLCCLDSYFSLNIYVGRYFYTGIFNFRFRLNDLIINTEITSNLNFWSSHEFCFCCWLFWLLFLLFYRTNCLHLLFCRSCFIISSIMSLNKNGFKESPWLWLGLYLSKLWCFVFCILKYN